MAGNWIQQFDNATSHKAYLDVVIADTETDTDVIDTLNWDITGISTDAAFDGTSLAIKTGATDDALFAISDETGEVRAIPIAASEFVELNINASIRWARYVQFVASAQTDDTTLRVYGRRLG